MIKSLILCFIFLFITEICSCQVNTTDAQISKTSMESKKNNLFIRKYNLSSTSDKEIIVEDAWVEKIWFNKIKYGKVVKEIGRGCQLCFKLKQKATLKYRVDNFDSWLIEYNQNQRYLKAMSYVGVSYGIYDLGFPNCYTPDTLVFNLIQRRSTGSDIIEEKQGNIIFTADQEKEKK